MIRLRCYALPTYLVYDAFLHAVSTPGILIAVRHPVVHHLAGDGVGARHGEGMPEERAAVLAECEPQPTPVEPPHVLEGTPCVNIFYADLTT